MALRKVLYYPNPRLRLKSEPVESVDDEVRQLIDDMFATMYEFKGIGLAAPQIDIQKQIIVMDVSDNKKQKYVFINPQVVEKSSDLEVGPEGCLSVPEICVNIKRSTKIKVNALDYDGKAFELEAQGLLAVCIQHEIDHLTGKLIIDYLSSLKKQLLLAKLRKEKQRCKSL
jgi:peptide deformylase